ncbi:Jtb family protein [Megaselia abdita]
MLENCTKKRMLLSLGTLVVVTIIVLIFESRVTNQSRQNRTTPKFEIESNSTCWKKERFTILHDCHPCPEEETTQKRSGVCIHTNYMEVIKCSSGFIVARSCDKAALDQQKDFVTFEVTMFVAGTLAFLVSYVRLRLLNRRIHLKIEKQLAAKG